MAQALPSFVDLLASLDLESDENLEVQHYARYPTSPSFVSSSPSSSLPSSSLPSSQTSPGRFLTSPGSASSFAAPSPSIVISHPSPVDDLCSTRRRSNSNRYNPYVPPNVFARRRSLPGDLTDHSDNVQKKPEASRPSTASPPLRHASLDERRHEPSSRSSTTRITMSETDQPISALVRRRHHSSPQSPTLPKAIRRSTSPTDTLSPVSIPSLPPLPRISTGANSPAPPFSGLPHLPPISALERRLPTPPERTNPPSRATSRTPQPSSCRRDLSHGSSFVHRSNEPLGSAAYACPSSS